MKVLAKPRESLTGSVTEITTFRMEMNAMAFHSVIDGIYADKVAAPFRELCTNARDGHAANGNLDEPFDVYLPSIINPIFKVRDYGIGLSHDGIMGMYTTMFASSKRDSNDAVGMIGLGSKSPFAYTSAFSVTSWFEGVQRIYSAFIGSSGVPEIALMHETESDERGGMEVQFPVKQEDVTKFRDAAQRVLFGFDPFPNILNERFVRTEPVINYSGDDWTMYASNTVPFTTLMARQGCVLYPIDPGPLGQNLAKPSYGQTNSSSIYTWPIVIDFPIGDLDVATSREALGYTPKTIANLKAKIDTVMESMTKLIDKEIQEAPTFIDACVIASAARTNNYDVSKAALFNLLFSKLTYQGRSLMDRIDVACNNKDAPFTWYDPQHMAASFYGNHQPSLAFRPKKFTNLRVPMSFFAKAKIYVEMPDLKNGPARMRKVIQSMPAQAGKDAIHVLWIRPTDAAARDALLTQMGNPSYIDLSAIEPNFVPKDDAKKNLTRFRYEVTTNQYDYVVAKYEYLVPTADMYYIKQTSSEFFIGAPNDPPLTITQSIEALRTAVQAGLLPLGMKVYYLNTTNIKVLETVKMNPIGDLILENAKKMDFATLVSQSDATSKNQRTAYANKLLASGCKMPSDLTTYVAQAAKQPAAQHLENHVHRALQRFVPDQLQLAIKQADSLKATWDQLMEKYPLLGHCVANYTPTGPTSGVGLDKLSHYLELISK